MRTIYSFLTVFILSCFVSIGVYAQGGEYFLAASENAETKVTREHFGTPLSDTEPWTIAATTLYKGEPSDKLWGSRLFHAYLCELPFKKGSDACGGEETNQFTSESKLCFYMRPPVGYPGGTTSNAGKLLLNNSPFTDVLNIDTENGTLFTFQIVSDGTGTVLVNVWIDGNNNGAPYTKTYTNNEIGTVFGLAAGQMYDVEALVTLGASQPILNNPGKVDFRTVLLGQTATKTVPVTGVNISGNVTGVISGTDAAYFRLTKDAAANNGGLEIEFTPDAERLYSAQLQLTTPNAEPITVDISGAGGPLPITLSSEDNTNEHWYYVQFVRRSGDARVWTADAAVDSITQSVLTPGSESQLWKVSGDWDNYVFTNKSGYEMLYDANRDTYLTEEKDGGDLFGFVHGKKDTIKNTQYWQIQNIYSLFKNKDTNLDVPNRNFINDYQGKSFCAYTNDDSGNHLDFIPATAERFFAGPDSIGFGTVAIGYPATKKYPVVQLNFTADAQVSFGGHTSGAFSAEVKDDSLHITFNPSGAVADSTLLTITAGAHTHTMKLTATGFQIPPLPFKVSENATEYWYQIQFSRQSAKAFQDNGVGEKIAQADIEAGKAAQLWKITGTWDKYKLVAKSGNEFKYDANLKRYIAAASGEGDLFRYEPSSSGAYQFYNMTVTSGNRYVCDAENKGQEILNYSNNDGGNVLNFMATFASISVTNLVFYEVEAGASFTKELTVSSQSLTNVITYALSGADANAFTVTAVEDDDENTPALAPNTLYQEGGKLSITFAPTEKKAYSATLTFTADGVDPIAVALTGTADFEWPVKISNDQTSYWYTLAFKRQSAKVLAVDEFGALAQVAKTTEPADGQLWKFTGTPAEGYQIANKTGKAMIFESVSALYGLSETAGDKHRMVRASNGTDWQLYNLTSEGKDGRYLNDFGGKGESAALYSANDGGNFLVFTFISGGTSIATPQPAGDVITATHYYTLQGLEVKKPAQTGIYIQQDIYASGRAKASKVYIVVR